jgi:hypothetical protein
MKFLYSDTQDFVDPDYDFLRDRHSEGREKDHTDCYAHELMSEPPYDGLLVAMSAVRQAPGVAKSKVRYTSAQQNRFLRDGARRYLRFGGPRFKDLMLMGDCGAFAYADLVRPPFSPQDVFDFYDDAGFTHGIAPDHVIFDCDLTNPKEPRAPDNMAQEDVARYVSGVLDRYEITKDNARRFLQIAREHGSAVEPVGPVQGWSPASMADAAQSLEAMGYRYLAIGGLVPLKVPAIKQVLEAIRNKIRPETQIHVLGFAKAESIDEFVRFDISSFDSTSPLIRAFKDAKANYYLEKPTGGLSYFTAIRVPQTLGSNRLMRGTKDGTYNPERLARLESKALKTLRSFDAGDAPAKVALESVMEYQREIETPAYSDEARREQKLQEIRDAVQETLETAPWKRCACDICRQVGIEVMIFRSNNHNRRRGFHNLGVYHRHVQRTLRHTA